MINSNSYRIVPLDNVRYIILPAQDDRLFRESEAYFRSEEFTRPIGETMQRQHYWEYRSGSVVFDEDLRL